MTLPAMLNVLEALPAGLLDIEPTAIHRILRGPTLVHLPGRREPPLFVSVFLHGNETTGFLAMQTVLRRYVRRPLPRALALFIGNIEAATRGLRRLDHQPDYNRIWPGHDMAACREAEMAGWIVRHMTERGVFASIDIHNNTGMNPHYACVAGLQKPSLHLAAMFGRLCIHSTQPRGTQTDSFAPHCPAVTLECGKPGMASGIEHAAEFVDACLRLAALPSHAVPRHDLDLYESIGQVLIQPDIDFAFGRADAELNLMPDLDRLNFSPVPAGFVWGDVKGSSLPVRVLNHEGKDVADSFFRVEEHQLRSTRTLMPSMLTLDTRVIRQDCLGYLMERISPDEEGGQMSDIGVSVDAVRLTPKPDEDELMKP